VSRLLVVGDALLDRDLDGEVDRLCPEAPVPVVEDLSQSSRPGGAALAAALAARDGHDVTLVAALAQDPPARELRTLLEESGVELLDLGLDGATPEKVRVRCDGRLLIRLDHGGRRAGRVGPARRLPAADAVLVSDYGRGVADAMRRSLAREAGDAALVWDPHPHGRAPLARSSLATPNRAEAVRFSGRSEPMHAAVQLRRRWQVDAVAVTVGGRGAILAEDGESVVVACDLVADGDPCGAGDRFASAAAGSLAGGAATPVAVAEAVERAAAFVAEGGAAAVGIGRNDRPAGGRPVVVATGGCFDLLHAGHVSMLQAARALGDRLVVLINSDESVRRLKGSDRPLVPQGDRAAVLRALGCVDDVVVFDEDTPARALERLRPDVWAKGGDYAADELPEAAVVRRHGGRIRILPYVEGRSTTMLLREAARVA
jgi:rfaE bifunctional protein nucleotidyltransferase chain/domain/rfaE bifunctional protein kinase chain/domain